MKATLLIGLAIVLFVVFQIWNNHAKRTQPQNEQEQSDQLVEDLVSSEELLLKLTPQLRPLSRSVMNLRLPDENASVAFAEQVDVSGTLSLSKPIDQESQVSQRKWSVAEESKSIAKKDLNLWSALFEETRYFEHAKFYFVRGKFNSNAKDQFETVVGFDGLAVYADSRKASLRVQLDVTWTQKNDSTQEEVAKWEIASWKLTEVEAMETEALLFRNMIAQAIPQRDLRTRATASKHARLTSDLMAGKEYFFPPGETYPLFFPDVTLEHPGIAVVDIDDDGFEDLYVAMQHEPNLLLRNKGDGTFEEVAAKYGLDILGDSTSPIFADFDNDGDPDLFLGRARRRSMYLVNEGGKFVDKSAQWTDGQLPALVSSISAVDYNNDGLLDVYLCTYSPIEESNRFQVANKPMWVDLFLTPQQGREVLTRNKRSHRFLDRAGPPNLLLQNVGDGKFEVAKENSKLELWRMTFQAAWNDFDRDGDQDVYVANDYGPDNLFRNDGPDGFKDITTESGLTGMGFGMGVSWGDYDNDGQIDVFVTNMFSKAGQRITSQVSDIDPKIRELAQGNFLYRLDQGKFSRVSGTQDPDLKVAKSGWSWGGQFFDFDNDGFQDIYATSGYYTAPVDVAIDLDL